MIKNPYTVYFDPETLLRLSSRADEEETSAATLIRQFVDEGLLKPSRKLRLEPQFERMIFLGNGERSARLAGLLHALVDNALSTLSGMQQGGDDDGTMKLRLLDQMKNICAAFGFDAPVHYFKELPYP